jgi:cephalosporin-C deacetylase-like acetyl esterase
MHIDVAVTLLCVQTTVLSTTPDDFAQFWKEVMEKASEEQIAAAYAPLPDRVVQKNGLDLLALTNEELQTLERIASKVSKR